MRSRWAALAVAVAGLLAACGSVSDDSSTTAPDITLLTTPTVDEAVATDAPERTDPVGDPVPSAGGSVSGATDENTSDGAVSSASAVSSPASVGATTAAISSTTMALPATETRFELTTSGIGSTSFGADPDGTVAFVSSFFGQPSSDTGWVDPFDIGVCNGSRLRRVAWGDLQLEFGDVSDVTEGSDHFYAYTYGAIGEATANPPGLATPEKITVGSSVADLLRTYPGAQLLEGDDINPPSFTVSDNLNGRLSGLSDTDVVDVIIGGLPCQS